MIWMAMKKTYNMNNMGDITLKEHNNFLRYFIVVSFYNFLVAAFAFLDF